ncbi:DUF1116 domain-containing protein [Brevibacillus sp. SYSU BS000544]|uniref:DUF1116 domain-containing protein n=1 Tax=Brevibacillus sp. SYSU BS000544 TaxID=3416443 RepID=UPI003CE5AADF
MSRINQLFKQNIAAVNIGAETFKEDLKMQDVEVVHVAWKPPAGGNVALAAALDKVIDSEKIEEANNKALEIIMSAQPMLVSVDRAIDVIPGMTPTTILHAGPPIGFDRMPGPMKGAVIGALMYEGMASTPEKAVEVATSGKINFAPCHNYSAVGAMTGVFSANMTVHVIKNATHGNMSYCPIHEGSGYTVQRYGSYDEGVLKRLKWLDEEYRPAMQAALKLSGGIDIRSSIAQALHMSDECHNRNKASTALFYKMIVPYLLQTDLDKDVILRVSEFINSNEHYHLSLTMAASKASLDAAHGIENCTIVTALSRNGADFGIRVSGFPGNTWFTGPAQMIEGLFFPGFSEADANPDMGDSAISETAGLGGFSLGNAPAIVQFVGGTVEDALSYVKKMYEITWTENKNYTIPFLNFRGTPAGVDIRKVIETGILPMITTGIAHKERGRGQIGAGITTPPMECFEKALLAFSEKYEI